MHVCFWPAACNHMHERCTTFPRRHRLMFYVCPPRMFSSSSSLSSSSSSHFQHRFGESDGSVFLAARPSCSSTVQDSFALVCAVVVFVVRISPCTCKVEASQSAVLVLDDSLLLSTVLHCLGTLIDAKESIEDGFLFELSNVCFCHSFLCQSSRRFVVRGRECRTVARYLLACIA